MEGVVGRTVHWRQLRDSALEARFLKNTLEPSRRKRGSFEEREHGVMTQNQGLGRLQRTVSLLGYGPAIL